MITPREAFFAVYVKKSKIYDFALKNQLTQPCTIVRDTPVAKDSFFYVYVEKFSPKNFSF
jgi:membrane carboxypeptidase/penicillin-binding protein PbpC